MSWSEKKNQKKRENIGKKKGTKVKKNKISNHRKMLACLKQSGQ